MKVCILSDTHLSSQKYSKMDHNLGMNRFMVRQFETMEWIVNYLKENDVKTIVHGGDMFDSSRVTVYPIERTKKLLKDFDVYAIKGNHDDSNFLHDNEMSALSLLDINCFNKPGAVDIGGTNFVFIPWGYNIDLNLIEKNKKNVLVAHGYPRPYTPGTKVNNKTDVGGMLSNRTEKFDLVITGHYHSIDGFVRGKTHYLNPGSISATANDSGNDPSIWILDTETLKYDRAKIPCAVKLIRETPKDVNNYLDNITEENIYRLSVVDRNVVNRKTLIKARKIALDIQFKQIIVEDKNDNKSNKFIDPFWDYVNKNSSYTEDFKKVISELEC